MHIKNIFFTSQAPGQPAKISPSLKSRCMLILPWNPSMGNFTLCIINLPWVTLPRVIVCTLGNFTLGNYTLVRFTLGNPT